MKPLITLFFASLCATSLLLNSLVLSDQDTQFMSRIMKEASRILSFKQLIKIC